MSRNYESKCLNKWWGVKSLKNQWSWPLCHRVSEALDWSEFWSSAALNSRGEGINISSDGENVSIDSASSAALCWKHVILQGPICRALDHREELQELRPYVKLASVFVSVKSLTPVRTYMNIRAVRRQCLHIIKVFIIIIIMASINVNIALRCDHIYLEIWRAKSSHRSASTRSGDFHRQISQRFQVCHRVWELFCLKVNSVWAVFYFYTINNT